MTFAPLAYFVAPTSSLLVDHIGRHSTSSLQLTNHWASYAVGLLRGGEVGEVSELIEKSYEWCTNLGAPAALVAGAVIATMYENINSGDLDIKREDGKWTRFGKKVCRGLLLSAFGFEVMSIFVTTVTGTMLLYEPLPALAKSYKITADTTPLSFLRGNFEFEYLTARLSFLQGLLNWLAAIGLGHVIPTKDELPSTRAMNRFIGCSLLSLMILMLAFYNAHMTYYSNLPHMLWRWLKVTCKRFICNWPPRPLAVVFIPVAFRAMYLGYKAFGDFKEEDEKFQRRAIKNDEVGGDN